MTAERNPGVDELDRAIGGATQALLRAQRPNGHWVFELEADATIPSEYVLLVHYLGEPANLELERKIGVYLRRIRGAHGGWPLFHDGPFDLSATVKAYFALKMIGDSTEAPHMREAREAILKRGGAQRASVFTRFLLALYGELPWRATPSIPVEMIFLPRWFPVHLSKMSYWARTVIVPLLVLAAVRPRARNPREVRIAELFVPGGTTAPGRAPHQSRVWATVFGVLDRTLKLVDPLWPTRSRKRAVDACVAFVSERLNGEDGLGAIRRWRTA
jgi:squalene-hopene/tetraprenyl-beta-curcumene cyclase